MQKGVALGILGRFDAALACFETALELDPKSGGAYYGRGVVWGTRGDLDKAIADFDTALRFSPNDPAIFANRGIAWGRKREWARALKDLDEAIRLGPTSETFSNRGLVWIEKREWAKALADFDSALALNPNEPTALYRRALVRSACPDAKLRDGKKALADATRLNSLLGKDDASAIECLAAARAEVGQFDEAVKLQTRLLELTINTEWDVGAVRERLKLYEQKKPHRLPEK